MSSYVYNYLVTFVAKWLERSLRLRKVGIGKREYGVLQQQQQNLK